MGAGRMRKPLLVLLAVSAAFALPGDARPDAQTAQIGQCGLPSSGTWWVDFGDGSVPFWETFAQPGNIVAASNVVYPPQIRERGAQTVYFDLYLNNRIGTPSAPKPASTIQDRALRLLDIAVRSSGCEKPIIALNEMFGANLPTPWSATNVQYRENLLTFLRVLSERGARPFLLISTKPYAAPGPARDWWLEATKVADLVPEVYFNSPSVYRAGVILGNRRLRAGFRDAIRRFTEIGIPPDRLGLVLGFQTKRGTGGREGLQPAHAWFETIKWQALAARQVSAEMRLGSVWSWGWAAWNDAARDPDKPGAACVYLWARDERLCDGPGAAGPAFNDSRTEGQILLRRGRQCVLGRQVSIESSQVAAVQRLTGDRDVAYTTLLARAAETSHASVPTGRVRAAERAVIALRFSGNAGTYAAAIAAAGATRSLARAVLADELRRLEIERSMPYRRASRQEATTFYFAYPELLTREVQAKPAPWWLGGKPRGLALEALAPDAVFELASGQRMAVRDIDTTYEVRALGDLQPLGSIPLEQARPAISAALDSFARRSAFERWSVFQQNALLKTAICRGDEYPAAGPVRLTAYLPFLSLTGR
jgi:hypothetical protein